MFQTCATALGRDADLVRLSAPRARANADGRRSTSLHRVSAATAPGEDQASVLEEGESVEVAVGDRTWTGRVAEIVGAVDSATRRRTVRIDLPAGVDPPVGAFARLLLPGPAEERLVAPARVVVARGGLEMVWAVSEQGRADLRYVRTGAARDGLVELRSGVAAGERLVLDPPADLEAGTRIRS